MTDIKSTDLADYSWAAFLNRIKVEVIEVDERTQGGIFLPPELRDKQQKGQAAGIVLDIGLDAYSDYNDKRLKVGDLVLFAKYAGEVVIGSEGKQRIINDTDIYSIGYKKEVTNG